MTIHTHSNYVIRKQTAMCRPFRGFGLIDLLILICSGVLIAAIFLPQLNEIRESSRRSSCSGNLRLIGVALQSYHEMNRALPPGYAPSDYSVDSSGVARWKFNVPAYAWSAFLLDGLGYNNLHNEIDVKKQNLSAVVNDPLRCPLLRTAIREFRCPSDQILEAMDSSPITPFQQPLDRGQGTVFGGSSSYVGNGGYFELNHPQFLAPRSQWNRQAEANTGPNNGVFYVASSLHNRQISDGLSNTISIGERAWYQGSASWVGTANVHGINVGDTGVCLGRVWWRINELPQSTTQRSRGEPALLVTRENRLRIEERNSAREGFGSYHPTGANFLMADGSVRFIDDQIDFANTIPVEGANPLLPVPKVNELGVFQRLGIRNDGQDVSANDVGLKQ